MRDQVARQGGPAAFMVRRDSSTKLAPPLNRILLVSCVSNAVSIQLE
jgi:hypothetical protein